MSTKQLERGFGQGRRIIKDTKHKERINGHENNYWGQGGKFVKSRLAKHPEQQVQEANWQCIQYIS